MGPVLDELARAIPAAAENVTDTNRVLIFFGTCHSRSHQNVHFDKFYSNPRRMKWLLVLAAVCFLSLRDGGQAIKGVDMSVSTSESMSPSTWSCLVNNGFEFAIIEAWIGGYGLNNQIAKWVGYAYNAGMVHVDIYVFMCPNCYNNYNASEVIVEVFAPPTLKRQDF